MINQEIKAQRGKQLTGDLRDINKNRNPGLIPKSVTLTILIYLPGEGDESRAGIQRSRFTLSIRASSLG